jgi:Clr5 domain
METATHQAALNLYSYPQQVSYPLQYQHTPNQAIESAYFSSVQNRLALEHAHSAEQKSTVQPPHVSHALESILPPSSKDEQHNLQLHTAGLGPTSSSMGPPPKKRKRKAPTLNADVWDPYRGRILELHISQRLPLKEVQRTIEAETGFSAKYVLE